MSRSAEPSPAPPRLVFWESTARCNLECVHCRRLDAGGNRDVDLTAGQITATMDSIRTLGQPIFVFSGGEPLLRDDWRELADHAREIDLPAALATNGTLIDQSVARDIAETGLRRVSISLDGSDAATHDAFRGQRGAFDAACRGATLVKQAGVPIQINATIASHNDDQLDALADRACQLQAVALHLFLLVPVGCGAEIGPSHQLSPDRYERVLGWIADHQDSRMEIRATCGPHYYRVAAQKGLDVGRGKGCLCGQSVAFINHRGRVYPCGYLPIDCGSVIDTPFDEIWRTSETFAALRDPDRLGGKCGRCEYRRICGGCRARAFAATGDFLAEEPSCRYQPRSTNE
ncbi:MAG: radical SAM protein [Planctomycetota bacterium]